MYINIPCEIDVGHPDHNPLVLEILDIFQSAVQITISARLIYGHVM